MLKLPDMDERAPAPTRILPGGRLAWHDVEGLPVGGGILQVAHGLKDQSNHVSGLRRDATSPAPGRGIFRAAMRLHNYLLVDGFIERTVGALMRKHFRGGDVFLEVGCGDMAMERFLPDDVCYNAFDLSLSEDNVKRLFARRKNASIALASAKSIPLDSGSVTLLVSTECLEHIPGVDEAVREIRRVCKTGARVIISIPNNHGRKYQVKGPHPEHVNNWTFREFTDFMGGCGLKLLEGFQKGYWIPFPLSLTRVSYQLPLISRQEARNTNFFYVFEAV
jgi:SAM-dependent methyltransferase